MVIGDSWLVKRADHRPRSERSRIGDVPASGSETVYPVYVEKTIPAAAPCRCGRLQGCFNLTVLHVPTAQGVASFGTRLPYPRSGADI